MKPIDKKIATKELRSKPISFDVKETIELMPFLLKKMDGISRSTAKSLLAKRQVMVNNVISTTYNQELKPGMKVDVSREKGKRQFSSPFVKLLYEDRYLLVVEKREGIPSILEESPKERSVYTILSSYVRVTNPANRVFMLHRLDNDTSGLMFFVKNEKVKKTMQSYWSEIMIERNYVAVVEGNTKEERGSITSWLMNDKIVVVQGDITNRDGQKVTTHYQTIKRENGFSLLDLQLKNNSKEKIRMHMHNLQTPILGDVKFGSNINPIGRLALHAYKLKFHHPITGEILEFETPYPSRFKGLVIVNDHKE